MIGVILNCEGYVVEFVVPLHYDIIHLAGKANNWLLQTRMTIPRKWDDLKRIEEGC